MNDFEFGNRICALRRAAGLTQEQVGRLTGVSAKAVSKWETGAAKPRIEALRKLASVLGESVDELLRMQDEKPVRIEKVVITGGPCAGKSTAMSWVQNALTERGWKVLFVPETATELIGGGVAPWEFANAVDFQACLMRLQLEKEAVFEQAARTLGAPKVLIVCDRGALDNRAYMSQSDFALVVKALGTNEVALRDGYDAVFHLVTAAKGAVEFYTCANNAARTETPEQAAALDDKLIEAWTGHARLRVIGNEGNFEDKMRRLVREMTLFLGEPEPYEIERKYLIKRPDRALLDGIPSCTRVEIAQTYLTSKPGEERRVRQRGCDGSYLYYETVKRPAGVDNTTRIELERRLTQDQYLALLMEADPALRPIRKDRWCLADGGQYFEIDIFPGWDDVALLEIELNDPSEEVRFPEFIEVIREVTDDENYRNANIARKDPQGSSR